MDLNTATKKIIAIEKDITTLYKKDKELTAKISSQEKLVEVIHQLALDISSLAKDVDYIKSGQDTIKKDVEELKNKPKKYMDVFITGTISALLGGIITFLFIRLGMR